MLAATTVLEQPLLTLDVARTEDQEKKMTR
jgi:hypothetical protein